MRDALEDKLFGVLSLAAPVTLSGEVAIIDSDDDGVADRLESMPEFGGTLHILPEPLAPSVKVSFEATR